MKTRLKLSAVLVLSTIVFSVIIAAEAAPPPIPLFVYGSVSIDGNLAPVGTKVLAEIDEVEVVNITTTQAGKYFMEVPDGKANENKIIVFKVNNIVVKDENNQYKVSNVATTPSVNFNLASITPTPSPTPTGGGGSSASILPTNISISIAAGAATTATRDVTLTLGATNATQMVISNTSDFTGASWIAYATSKPWILTSGNGTKTVYAKFQNASGVNPFIVSDTIVLSEADGKAPEAEGKVLSAESVNIIDGDIIQSKSSENPFAVYIVKIVGDTKYIRHIVSLEIFNYYGHLDWNNLKQVDSLDNYSLSGWVRYNTGANGAARPNDKVYEINGDQSKHWINMTAEQFLTHGGSDPAIYSVNQGELNLYTTGADVMSL